MSTLASLAGLLGQMPQIRPWDEAQRSVTQAETGLITLADLKAKHQAEQEYFLAVKNDPRVREALFGGSVLGSIGPAGGMAAPGAGLMTQQTVQPGMPPGAPQMVPGGQDLSRFAGVSPQGGGPLPAGVGMPTVTPPQSTLGSLGPAGQPQAHAPQNPLLAMAAKDPRAAMMLQQQLEGRQDVALKRQEQQLTMGTKIMEYLGRGAQGVTDQASLDAFRQEVARVHPQAAASLPQTYRKEAMAPFIAKAVDVKEAMTLQINEMKARADQIRAGLAGRSEAVNTELEIMGLAPAQVSSLAQQGDPQAQAHLAEATQRAESRQVRIQKAGVTPQIVEGEGGIKYSVDPHTLERRTIPGGAPGTQATGPGGAPPGEPMRGPMSADDKKLAAYATRMQEGQQQLNTLEKSGDYTTWKAPLSKLPGGRLLLSDKQKEYENAKAVFLMGVLRRDSAGQITEEEWKSYGEVYFPQPDDPPQVVEQKRKFREHAIQTEQAVLGRPLPQGRTGTQTQPASPGSAKPVGQMSKEDLLAEKAAILARGGQ
jgi:hypothetical protein